MMPSKATAQHSFASCHPTVSPQNILPSADLAETAWIRWCKLRRAWARHNFWRMSRESKEKRIHTQVFIYDRQKGWCGQGWYSIHQENGHWFRVLPQGHLLTNDKVGLTWMAKEATCGLSLATFFRRDWTAYFGLKGEEVKYWMHGKFDLWVVTYVTSPCRIESQMAMLAPQSGSNRYWFAPFSESVERN